MFAPPPNSIIDDDDRILPEVLAARRRGGVSRSLIVENVVDGDERLEQQQLGERVRLPLLLPRYALGLG